MAGDVDLLALKSAADGEISAHLSRDGWIRVTEHLRPVIAYHFSRGERRFTHDGVVYDFREGDI